MFKVLVVVDPQNDFCHKNGALYIQGAEGVLYTINDRLRDNSFNMKIITQDWHPKNHMSFAVNFYGEGNVEYFSVKTLKTINNTEIDQVMWPAHCVAGTWGAEIHHLIEDDYADMIIRKGTEKENENYSFLEYATNSKESITTPYFEMFKGIDNISFEIVGYATDVCCYNTAKSILNVYKDILHRNVEVIFNTEGMKAVNNDNAKTAIDDLEKRGAVII